MAIWCFRVTSCKLSTQTTFICNSKHFNTNFMTWKHAGAECQVVRKTLSGLVHSKWRHKVVYVCSIVKTDLVKMTSTKRHNVSYSFILYHPTQASLQKCPCGQILTGPKCCFILTIFCIDKEGIIYRTDPIFTCHWQVVLWILRCLCISAL